jgi:hypothetical protein
MPISKDESSNIFNQYADSKITIQQAFNMSANWYTKKVAELRSITPNDLLKHKAMYTNQPVKGEMYCFIYDPKHKDTLPYYDTFPMVLPLSKDKDSFLGLNFHYISPKDRIFLLDAIRRHGKGTSRLNITWEIMAGWAGTKRADNCIKRYLFSHMRSPLRRIRTEDIPTALMIPVERFVKKRKQDIWKKT